MISHLTYDSEIIDLSKTDKETLLNDKRVLINTLLSYKKRFVLAKREYHRVYDSAYLEAHLHIDGKITEARRKSYANLQALNKKEEMNLFEADIAICEYRLDLIDDMLYEDL